MNAVGIDVSKGKSMVTILRPFGEIVSSPFEIKHTQAFAKRRKPHKYGIFLLQK